MTSNTGRFTVQYTDRFKAAVEYNPEFIVVHFTDVSEFNISTFRAIQRSLDEYEGFFRMFYTGIYAAPPTGDPKLARLLGLLGFEYVGTCDGRDVWYRQFE